MSLAKPQCSNGTNQSRPFSARSVKPVASARQLKQNEAGGRGPNDKTRRASQLDFKIQVDKPTQKISRAVHRSKYAELRGLDPAGADYKTGYSKIWRAKNSPRRPAQSFSLPMSHKRVK